MTTSNSRTADYPIDPIFLDRWSPRSFSGEPIRDADLFTIFEAARWAPSSSNLQPWRFLYAKRDTSDWPVFFDTLTDGNKRWVHETSVLIAVLSKRTRQPKEGAPVENYTHTFDTGAAWAYMALQAHRLGWVAHGMAGFSVSKAVEDLGVPEDYRVECMVAIGRYREDATSPAKPNSRSPQASFVRAGVFKD